MLADLSATTPIAALFDEGLGVTQVAMELGYSSGTAFTKMFRRLTGTTPRANEQIR